MKEYIAVAFKGKPRAATGGMVPSGFKNRSSTKKLLMASGDMKENRIMVAVIDIWLCETDDEGGMKKIRVLHSCEGPTAEAQANDFIKIWKPDSAESFGPQCPADGKKVDVVMEEQGVLAL